MNARMPLLTLRNYHGNSQEYHDFFFHRRYVFFLRSTDPQKIMLVGVLPKDKVEDLAQALIAKGIDADEYFEDAGKVTRDWEYDRNRAKVVDRFFQRYSRERSITLKRRNTLECLRPQAEMHVCQWLVM